MIARVIKTESRINLDMHRINIEEFCRDRGFLYHKNGSDLVVTDKAGEACGTAYLSPDDALLIPSGGYKQGTVNDADRWVDKSELTACDFEGNELKQYASSFDAVISLDKTVSEEEFLDNNWEAVYQLVNPELAAAVDDNIYKFEFSYRGGTNHNDGYLINTPGGLFLFAGDKQDSPTTSSSTWLRNSPMRVP